MADRSAPELDPLDVADAGGSPSERTFRDLPRLRAFALLLVAGAIALLAALAVAGLAGGRTDAHRGLGSGPRIAIIAAGFPVLAGLVGLAGRVLRARVVVDRSVVTVHNFFATVTVPTAEVVRFCGGRSSGFLTSATAVCTDGRRISVDAVARPSGPALTEVLGALDRALITPLHPTPSSPQQPR